MQTRSQTRIQENKQKFIQSEYLQSFNLKKQVKISKSCIPVRCVKTRSQPCAKVINKINTMNTNVTELNHEIFISSFNVLLNHFEKQNISYELELPEYELELPENHDPVFKNEIINLLHKIQVADEKVSICLQLFKFINLGLLKHFEAFIQWYEVFKLSLVYEFKLRLAYKSKLMFEIFSKTFVVEKELQQLKCNGVQIDKDVEFELRENLIKTRLIIIKNILPVLFEKAFI